MENRSFVSGLGDKKLWITVGVSAALSAIAYLKISDLRHKGPLKRACKHALERGEFEELSDWIQRKYSDEAYTLFEKTIRVRALGDEAKEIADQNFMEKMLIYCGA